MNLEKYYCDLRTLHVNTEPNRSYFEVYSNIENAKKQNEDRKQLLNGEWDFTVD